MHDAASLRFTATLPSCYMVSSRANPVPSTVPSRSAATWPASRWAVSTHTAQAQPADAYRVRYVARSFRLTAYCDSNTSERVASEAASG
jgi:hypothetical protein